MSEGGDSGDDPFHWSPERLLQELCTANRSWVGPPPRKWPDLDHLAKVLQEHELDGQDLMTYEDLGGREAFDSLCKDLEIRKIPHKASLSNAIKIFQSRSPAYKAWKESQLPSSQAIFVDVSELQSNQTKQESSANRLPAIATGSTDTVLKHPQETNSVSPPCGQPSPPVSEAAAPVIGETDLLAIAVQKRESLHDQPSSPPPAKKVQKRVALVNISSEPLLRSNQGPFGAGPEIPDGSETNALDGPEQLWQTSIDGAYLGHWQLTEEALLRGRDPLDPEDDVDSEAANFSWSTPRPIPPGRRLQVHRTVRRFLRPRKPARNLGRSRGSQSDGTNGAAAAEDVVLPALGESDDEEYDSETWEAMQQEEEERKNLQKRKNAPLSSEAVGAIVADTIHAMETKWADKKLPKLRRREHALWKAARHSGSRRWEANKARLSAEELGQRIEKLVKEICAEEWKTAAEVRRQAVVLEASVEDKQHALWLAKLFSLPAEPPRLKASDRLAAHPRRRRIRVRVAEDGAETLTSSSSEDEGGGLGDFIVMDDDVSEVADDSRAEHDSVNDPMIIDSAGPSSPGAAGIGVRHATAAPSEGSIAVDFPLDNMAAIAEKGLQYWEGVGDARRLLCTMIFSYNKDRLWKLFDSTQHDEVIWQKFCVPAMATQGDSVLEASKTIFEDDACAFARFFYAFLTCRAVLPGDFIPMKDETRSQLLENRGSLGKFRVQMRILLPYIQRLPDANKRTLIAGAGNGPSEREVVRIDTDDIDDSQSWTVASERDEGSDDDNDVQRSPSYRRKREIRRDQDAQNLRDKDRARLEAQENRRKFLYERLAQSGIISEDQSRLIINTAKDEHHGLVYISPTIGRRIRDHQIEGVRFMWNQIVVSADVRQGCLLAHTMGLGKTMQVITLLVAIAEAASSPDETIRSQIPSDLRESKTLILCPSGLVQNWLDELLTWAPPDLLGNYYEITAEVDVSERFSEVKKWASGGGVLVLGYPMLRRLLSDFQDEIQLLLEESPNIVVADEAHILKNPQSKVHEATANFRTSARIAMTGSPLANCVEEYHSMINWVAPNYLADHREFVSVYANPIKEGFYKDSTASQRRRAIKMLKVLKDTVAPKIHRATVAALKGELPPKKEFILYLPLTELQLKVYSTFIKNFSSPTTVFGDINSTLQLWNLLINMALLLAHPKVFQMRLQEMMRLLGAQAGESRSVAPSSRNGLLPPSTVRELLSRVAQRDIDNLQHSSKILVLMGILDEAKRIGDKVLVFSQSKLVLDYLEEVFRRQKRCFSRLDGDTAVSKRQGMVKDFNTGEDEIYLISTTAGGVGLNIQGANRVVILDFKWNPIHEQQAIGRTYRIGQTKPVFVYWLITGGTFETVLHDQAVFKTQLASRVVDKKNPTAWADQMRNYTQEPRVMRREEPTMDLFLGQDAVLDALFQSSSSKDRICKIVSTDTFEEEEPEDKLSAEELHEANNMVSENEMRRRNPQEASTGPALYSERMSVAGACLSSDVPGVPPVPFPAPVLIPPQSMTTQVSDGQLVGADLAGEAAHTSAPPPPMQIPLQDQTRIVSLHGQPALTTPTMPISMEDGQSNGLPQSDGPHPVDNMSPFVTRSISGTPEELEVVLQEKLIRDLFKSGQNESMASARMMASEVVSRIRALMEQSGLPAMLQWARLRNRASDDALFAHAIITGGINPHVLANMTQPKEEEIVHKLHTDWIAQQQQQQQQQHTYPESGMFNGAPGRVSNSVPSGVYSFTRKGNHRNASHEVEPAAPVRAKDPDRIKGNVRRSLHRPESRADGKRRPDDVLAMEEVLLRRKRKQTSSTWTPPGPPAAAQPSSTWPPHQPQPPQTLPPSQPARFSPSPVPPSAPQPHLTITQSQCLPKPKKKKKYLTHLKGEPSPSPSPSPMPSPPQPQAGDNIHNPFILD